MDKHIINSTTESTKNTEEEWWKESANVFYGPGENARTTSVQRAQLTGLTPECTGKSVSKDANGNISIG